MSRSTQLALRPLAARRKRITTPGLPNRKELDMSNGQTGGEPATENGRAGPVDMKLEVIVIPVSDVDRAKKFYAALGWRLDVDMAKDEHFRIVHFTPPGSQCSVLFGKGVTTEEPGSVQGLHLIVSDIEAVRAELVSRGVDVSEIFHDVGGVFHHAGEEGRVSGTHPTRNSYGSFASFNDPDGNGWVFQEVTTRRPGRVDPHAPSFSSAMDLASALRRAAAAHGEHEKLTGQHDENWPDWYAEFIVRERTGEQLPT
ncbi:VOC family protein [Paraburkholderia sp.]|uniref:VOC family protein n=1 Tax=Paraburkholderia sp. TaxID=1926495 RepID=UPI002D8004B2|nr:VOC family protein [Paraburkholderia sp.]